MIQAKHKYNFILASASAQRINLLAQIGYTPYDIKPANIDEAVHKKESARAYVKRIACEKAAHIAAQYPQFFILAGDTIIEKGGLIYQKPDNGDEARRFLQKLSGGQHRVYSAICLQHPSGTLSQKIVETRVQFKKLDTQEIEHYIASNEWQNCAGGYAIQGLAGAFIKRINGSHSNVVGLPLYETYGVLKQVPVCELD